MDFQLWPTDIQLHVLYDTNSKTYVFYFSQNYAQKE